MAFSLFGKQWGAVGGDSFRQLWRLETLHLSLHGRKNKSRETQKANAEMQKEILQVSLTTSST